MLIDWLALHNDKALRRRTYIDLQLEVLNIDLFSQLVIEGLDKGEPCSMYFEVGDRLQKIAVRALPGCTADGWTLLDWVGSWAAARKLQLRDTADQMEGRWPYLGLMWTEMRRSGRLQYEREVLRFPPSAVRIWLKRALKSIFGRLVNRA